METKVLELVPEGWRNLELIETDSFNSRTSGRPILRLKLKDLDTDRTFLNHVAYEAEQVVKAVCREFGIDSVGWLVPGMRANLFVRHEKFNDKTFATVNWWAEKIG